MPLTKATRDNINSGTAAAGAILAADGVGGANWSTPTVQTPAGAVMHYAMQTAPDGWLVCNGSTISRLTYPALFAAIGISYGAGDGVTTFKLPDLRGEFIRGWDGGRGVDGGRAFGTLQAESFKSHTHTVTDPGHVHSMGDEAEYEGDVLNMFDSGKKRQGGPVYTQTATTGISIAAAGGTETRPRNVALLPCIKY
jgi:microcystin-dependent protein